MSVAIRTAVRLQDQDDVNVSLGAGVDEYALCWDNDTAKFVLRATTGYDHGLLAAASLSDDDHTQYALLAGRAGGQTLYGGTAANDDITIHGTSDSTRTTSYVLLQPSGGNVGIGTSAPEAKLHVVQQSEADIFFTEANTANYGANWVQRRSRGTNASKTVLQDGDIVGGMIAQGYDGAAYRSAGRVALYVDGTPGSSDMPGRIEFRTTPDGTATEQTRMVIKNSGNVGIGTDAPTTPLHAVSTTATTGAIRNVLTLGANVTSTGVGAAGLGAAVLFQGETSTTIDSDMAQIGALWTTATHATRASALTFSTLTAGGSLTERMRIDGAGNVGIGTSAPVARLHISDITTEPERGLIIAQTNTGAQAALLNFRKSRSGAVVENGDYIGLFFAMPFDGTNYIQPAGFGFKVNGTVSANSVPTDLIFSVGSASAGSLQNERMRITSAGLVGIGTTAPGTMLHTNLVSAATNAVTNVLTIGHDTSGTAAAGFGAGLAWKLESSTTAAQDAARIAAVWNDATHATRKADLILSAYDTAEREGLRIRGNGSAPAIGFYGVTPIERATLATGAGASVDDVITALQNLGLVKQS